MKPMNFRGRWVLITGASSGLGLEMARLLAKEHGAHIIAVARREDRLTALKAELESAHGVQVLPLSADLTKPGDAARVFETATSGRTVDGVILNAGVTYFGHALEQQPESFDAMLATNITSVVRMSQLFGAYFAKQSGGGALMLVASTAGFAPLPYQTAYAATKSFVISYGRGLAYELRKVGVSVTVFAPGGIATEMLSVSGLDRKFKAGDVGIMSAEACARTAVEAFVHRRELSVPGVLNRFLATMMKLLPHGFMMGRSAALYEGALPKEPPAP
ncbi:SDR family NAD(P)-dependent oxidoreductase [Corallococcus exiguus]|uniref:SDR family NAD(P)-dependent oxidoreductase n=1 Tax=Corallococcus TaxID=83461 RepID=UPI000EA172BF|nr:MULTISPECIES: SDR family NAD(P)-dependent oxidoreductase [Corallococcus]NNC17036.1 SDR family NAD(P)-dependent oxidoreductase [Corallococcus exiguus]NRD54603.1 SDR family NAD(P)-dependent oxidoreductase [Corallococcus exiguus]RKH27936.1 SDR family NAD(P)-dependent oxidoreductase [Corallococcus sp. CA041A]RUO90081.1 SDR family NAD(P)-dependent oxidoreductase [Corallococcus sp. AB018]